MLPLLPERTSVVVTAVAAPVQQHYGDEVELQQQYTLLCAEKCRLLSSIQQLNREGRTVQEEIHRLLEYVAELLPDDYLLSEVDSISPGDNDWLEESDEEFKRGEQLYEEQKVAELKEYYQQLLASAEVQQKKSASPERKPNKNRRSYKYLPLRDDGQVNFPVILGRGVQRTVLLQIGEISTNENFHDSRYIYPIGFQSKRKFYTFNSDLNVDRPKKVYYFCSIKKLDDHPLFEIASGGGGGGGGTAPTGDEEDDSMQNPSSTIYETLESDTNLSALWDRFCARFTPELQMKLEECFSCAGAFFGLEHESLNKHIKDLASSNLGNLND